MNIWKYSEGTGDSDPTSRIIQDTQARSWTSHDEGKFPDLRIELLPAVAPRWSYVGLFKVSL